MPADETITRDAMASTIEEIREDLAGWLAKSGDALQSWLEEPAPAPVKAQLP